MDDKLLDLLSGLTQYNNSRFKTCICIQLADYAAQMMGYRSTRQIDDSGIEDVENNYNELFDKFLTMVSEYQYLVEHRDKDYKKELESLDLLAIELLLEEALIKSVLFDDVNVFSEMFLE